MKVKQLTNLIVNMPTAQKSSGLSQTITVNPYNSRSDRFLLKNILGSGAGISIKTIAFDGASPKFPSFGDFNLRLVLI